MKVPYAFSAADAPARDDRFKRDDRHMGHDTTKRPSVQGDLKNLFGLFCWFVKHRLHIWAAAGSRQRVEVFPAIRMPEECCPISRIDSGCSVKNPFGSFFKMDSVFSECERLLRIRSG